MPRLNSSTKIRKIKRERERELSKTIATILTVIVIFASIIFITIVFFREDEERTKTSLKLEDIKISNNNLKITVENTGKIPIDKIILKIEGDKGKADFEYDGIDILNTKEIKIDLSTKDIGRPDRIEVTPNIAEKETTGRIFYSPRPSTLYEFSTEEQKAAVSAPNNIVTWHFDTHKANVSLINEIAETKFITHVIISNKDFNEEPTPNMSALDKLNATKEKGLIPIWERDLWFRRGNRSKELFAQPFIKNYTDGSIIYDKDYYIWFLNK
ncbi:hypothetical protein HYV50_04000, partial [Candidatus Pacearchaeota archaeon]|nr:hypothetical protein [Candidatus Pacearchaeota archaeon]